MKNEEHPSKRGRGLVTVVTETVRECKRETFEKLGGLCASLVPTSKVLPSNVLVFD